MIAGTLERAMSRHTGCDSMRPGLSAQSLDAVRTLLSQAAVDGHALSRLDGGGVIRDFEEAFSELVEARFAVSMSSCTSGLVASLLACGVEPGDEVILASYGWGGTAGAVLAVGAVPVFADIDQTSLNLDPDSVRQMVTDRTRVILCTHMFGQPADVPGLSAIARQHGLRLVCDAAQALGATRARRPMGAWGDIAVFSFGRGKLLTTGEGGMATTNNADLYERLVLVSQHPIRSRRELENPDLRGLIDETSLSSRLHPLAAVIGLAELPFLAGRLARRREFCLWLLDQLDDLPGFRIHGDLPETANAFHQLPLTLVAEEVGGMERREVLDRLLSDGVPVAAGPVATPIHRRHRFCGGSAQRGPLDSRRQDCGLVVTDQRCAEREVLLENEGRWLGTESERVAEMARAFRTRAFRMACSS